MAKPESPRRLRRRKTIVTLAVGLAFAIAVLGLGAVASTMGDPWGDLVAIVLGPGLFLNLSTRDLGWTLLATAIFWWMVGAIGWLAILRPICSALNRKAKRTP